MENTEKSMKLETKQMQILFGIVKEKYKSIYIPFYMNPASKKYFQSQS